MKERHSKKLFGVLNALDILIILVLVCAAAFGVYWTKGRQAAQTSAETKTYTYVVEGKAVLEETVDFPVVGQNVYNSSTSEYLGTVAEVWSEPNTETNFNRVTNTYEKVPVPGYCDIYVAITGNGTETEQDITVEGTVVKVGRELNIKGKGYAFKGYIVEVRDGEE